MSRIRGVIVSLSLLIAAPALAAEPIALRDMGSFHVGGRLVEISGKPVKEVVFTQGGVPAKIDPNGTYQVEQMYVQYSLPANENGVYPLLLWHGGGLTGATYETTPDGREGWLNYFLRKGWSVYNSDAVERGRAGWAQYPDIFKSEPVFLTTSVRTVSHRRRPRLLRSGPGEAKADARQPVSRRRLRQFRQAERAALDHQRRRHLGRVH